MYLYSATKSTSWHYTNTFIIIVIIFTPVLNSQGMKKIRCAIQKSGIHKKTSSTAASEALRPGSVLRRKGKSESPGEEECLQSKLRHSDRVAVNDSFR